MSEDSRQTEYLSCCVCVSARLSAFVCHTFLQPLIVIVSRGVSGVTEYPPSLTSYRCSVITAVKAKPSGLNRLSTHVLTQDKCLIPKYKSMCFCSVSKWHNSG